MYGSRIILSREGGGSRPDGIQDPHMQGSYRLDKTKFPDISLTFL